MVFNNIPYKQKFLALIVIFLMMSLASYKRVFRPTYKLIASSKEMNSNINEVNQAVGGIQMLEKEVDYLDRIMGDKQKPPEEVQQALLQFISRFESVNLYKLEDVHEFPENEFMVYSNQITLEGNYNDLASCIYALEKEFDLARIVNIKFYKEKEYQRKREKLFASIIFQNYLPNH